jgi:hypothetical protein
MGEFSKTRLVRATKPPITYINGQLLGWGSVSCDLRWTDAWKLLKTSTKTDQMSPPLSRVQDPLCLYGWKSDLIGVDSTKTRDNQYKLSFEDLRFFSLVFWQTGTYSVTISVIKMSHAMSFY